MSCTCSRGDEKDQLTVVYNKLDRIDTIDRITEANSAIWKQLRKIIIPVVSVWVLQGFVERCLWYVAQTLEKTLNLILQRALLVNVNSALQPGVSNELDVRARGEGLGRDHFPVLLGQKQFGHLWVGRGLFAVLHSSRHVEATFTPNWLFIAKIETV